jgi:hypothetical protein
MERVLSFGESRSAPSRGGTGWRCTHARSGDFDEPTLDSHIINCEEVN